MMHATTDGKPLRAREIPKDLSSRPLLRKCWRATLRPHSRFQADKEWELWIEEFRKGFRP
jgi:hypothetical protein